MVFVNHADTTGPHCCFTTGFAAPGLAPGRNLLHGESRDEIASAAALASNVKVAAASSMSAVPAAATPNASDAQAASTAAAPAVPAAKPPASKKSILGLLLGAPLGAVHVNSSAIFRSYPFNCHSSPAFAAGQQVCHELKTQTTAVACKVQHSGLTSYFWRMHAGIGVAGLVAMTLLACGLVHICIRVSDRQHHRAMDARGELTSRIEMCWYAAQSVASRGILFRLICASSSSCCTAANIEQTSGRSHSDILTAAALLPFLQLPQPLQR